MRIESRDWSVEVGFPLGQAGGDLEPFSRSTDLSRNEEVVEGGRE